MSGLKAAMGARYIILASGGRGAACAGASI